MSRALAAIGALLALAFVVLGAAVYLTRSEDRIAVDNLLAEDISRAFGTAEERNADIDLGRVADDFEWDELLMVRRGTPRKAISRELGREWKGDVGFQTGDLLIFLDGGEPARFADYRGEGRFVGVQRPFARFRRPQAVFTVDALAIRPRAG